MTLRFALALILAVSAFSLDASAQRGRGNFGYSGITVYEHPDFRGDSVTFRNAIPDMRQHGLNDRISSLEVDGNQAWEVCRDVHFGGGCRVFQGSIDDLRAEGWNDRISSMRAVGFARGNNTNRGGVFGNPRGNANIRNVAARALTIARTSAEMRATSRTARPIWDRSAIARAASRCMAARGSCATARRATRAASP